MRSMRIGRLLNLGDTPGIDTLRAQAADAAARGLDSVWANQVPGSWDPLGVLAPFGQEGPAELGTDVVPTYLRHPVAMAAEALAVQSATGGRLTLGIGPSHEQVITGMFGIPYTAPASHTREYLEVLLPLMRGEHVRHQGRFFTVDYQITVPAQPPRVLLSALGPRMLQIARDLTDGTIAIYVRPDTIADYVVPALGEGKRVVVNVLAAVTDDPDGVRAAFATGYKIIGDLPAYRALLDRGGLSGPADTIIAGTEEEVLRELQRFRDAGATDLVVMSIASTPSEKQRTLDLIAQAANDA
jgi:5,10-methylenetetrahydromethanopterin reductase